MKAFLSIIFCIVSIGLFAQQDREPIKWSFDINQVGPTEYELMYRADLDAPWVIYSKDTGKGGPIATSVSFTSDNVKPVDEGIESGERKEGMDELFGINVIKYSYKQAYILKQRVDVNDISKPITGYVTYMVCNNKVCIPPTDANFSFKINVLYNSLEKSSDGKGIKLIKKND